MPRSVTPLAMHGGYGHLRAIGHPPGRHGDTLFGFLTVLHSGFLKTKIGDASKKEARYNACQNING